jgi:hypothetical protein
MARWVGVDFVLLFVFIGAWALWASGALLVVSISAIAMAAWAAGGLLLLLGLNVHYARNPPSRHRS